MSLAQLLLIYAVSSCNAFGCMVANRRLHADAITNVMGARMSWFESTPSGRILSRFSGDFNNTDYGLQFAVDDCTHFLPYICALLAVIAFVIPELIVVIVCGGFLYGVQVVAVDKTNRESKRMANVALSPVLTTVGEAANGRLLLNVMNLQEFCFRRNHAAVDDFNRHNFTTSTITNWGTLIAQGLSFFIAIFSASFVLLERHRFRPVYAGLAITYSFLLPHFLGNLSAVMSMMFSGITSLERIYELQSTAFVPQDPGIEVETGATQEVVNSQIDGSIKFDNVTLVYRPGLPPAVRAASFTILPREKIGVVGRTGAGKSSLVSLLFRVVDCSAGSITVNGRNIKSLPIRELRKSIAIIPQDPLLLSGTIKHNLDPFEKYCDEDLLVALQNVGLSNYDLDQDIGINASALSAGQRQLLSLARTVIRKNEIKIVVMDEPTSNIDLVTDDAIQKTARLTFADKTVVTIAHRLNTIIDCKILVMDYGKVVEFDFAQVLLKNEIGHFRSMVDAMGETSAAKFRERLNM